MMKTRKERGELLYSAVNVIWERVSGGDAGAEGRETRSKIMRLASHYIPAAVGTTLRLFASNKDLIGVCSY